MATTYRRVDYDLEGTLEKLLYGPQVNGFRDVKRFANRCMAEGRHGLAGGIYEFLGYNRKAAAAYLKGGEIGELRRLMRGSFFWSGEWQRRLSR